MTKLLLLSLAIALILPLGAMAEQSQSCPFCSSLEIQVKGLRSSTGTLRILLTNDPLAFQEKDPQKIKLAHVFFRNSKADKSGVTFHFKELRSGAYAFKIFHDENSNEILDTSILGKPVEGLAVSGYSVFYSPEFLFEKAKFEIAPAKILKKEIFLKYYQITTSR